MAKGQEPETMEAQADVLIAMLEDADEDELKQIHAGGVKDSKWRRVVQAFIDSGKPIQKFNIPDDGPVKLQAVTSGLQNVMRRSENLPLKVKSSKLKKVVYLINTELVSEEAEPATEE
jgi:hypothetical protein